MVDKGDLSRMASGQVWGLGPLFEVRNSRRGPNLKQEDYEFFLDILRVRCL